MTWSIYNNQGSRKYLTADETNRLLRSAEEFNPATYGICWIMAASGCRISEALALTSDDIDLESKHVVIRCLKKRGKNVYRAVPLPSKLLVWVNDNILSGVLGSDRLWPWSRMTAYRRIRLAMEHAGLSGPFATPKGLRHAFGVRAIQAGAPLNMVQRWLGHADMKTTAIYTTAMGPEERAIAAKTWLDSDARYEKDVTPQRNGRPRAACSPTGCSRAQRAELPQSLEAIL